MLPKFLLADNSQELPETLFIVHTETPRFIVEFDIDDFDANQEIHWIDEEPENDIKNNLLSMAEDFVEDELDRQEELFDDEE